MVGDSAEVVNAYKKILVNQFDTGKEKETENEKKVSIESVGENGNWKDCMVNNPKA